MDDVKHPRLHKHPRSGRYYYRARVPVDLLDHYHPSREIKFSLGTADAQEALRKLRQEDARVEAEFEEARRWRDTPTTSTLTDQEIAQLASLHLHNLLREDDEDRLGGREDEDRFILRTAQDLDGRGVAHEASWAEGDLVAEVGMSARVIAKKRQDWAMLEEPLREGLARGDWTVAGEWIEEVLEENGIKLDPGSMAYKKLGMAVLRSTVDAFQKIDERLEGVIVETPPAPRPQAAVAWDTAPVPSHEDAENPLLSTVLAAWKRETNPREGTAADFSTHIRRFSEVNGDLRVRDIKPAHVRAFKDAMLQMPARLSHTQRKMTVPEIIRSLEGVNEVKRLTPGTVKEKSLAALRAILGYARRNGFVEDNPASGDRVSVDVKKAKGQRLPYTDEHLRAIFSSPVFADGLRPLGGGGEAAKWLPLLALYTGARLEEMGQLLVSDAGEEQGVAFLSINNLDEGKAIKNHASWRKVPIHPELKRMGFLDYVEERRLAGDRRLFPKVTSKREKVTAAWSTWWGRYARDEVGITDARRTFHSFRHNVKKALRTSGVDKTLRDALMGHASTDEAERYGLDEDGLGFALPTLAEALQKLRYPLDLSHLHI
jgi:integrase